MAKRKQKSKKEDKNTRNYEAAQRSLYAHPFFSEIAELASSTLVDHLPRDCWAQIDDRKKGWQGDSNAEIYCNRHKQLSSEGWEYILALAYLHLALNHMISEDSAHEREWRVACELYVQSFAKQVGVGIRPMDFLMPPLEQLPIRDERTLMRHFIHQENVQKYMGYGIGGSTLSWKYETAISLAAEKKRSRAFAAGLQRAVQAAVNEASDQIVSRTLISAKLKQANEWVINSFPLLSALASTFTLIEDADLCERMDIEIAAIHPQLQEVYIHPRWRFSKQELIFILLHEYLHVGLRHDVREQGRDPYYWNVACDYVINGWLVEMRVGEIPAVGMLYDPKLAGRGAEDIYDEIMRDLRWQRELKKTQTPCRGKPDIINDKPPGWWRSGKGVSLDEFYRRSLQEGLEYSQERGRGYIPAGLIEDIRAINQPPIAWDVELTKWLDQFFPPIEARRSYARLSRRQSTTPDIPRPSWIKPEEESRSRTFGVILDTSASMSRRELAMALGAISAYAGSRDVPYVRLVYCDAAPYDAGYVETESLLERIKLKGRGGTVLQPAVDLLERAEDFPKRGPVLVITDGYIDHLRPKMEHAYLLPKGMRLPYRTASPVFYFEE